MKLEELIKRTEKELNERKDNLKFQQKELIYKEDRVKQAKQSIMDYEELLTKLETL